MNELDEEKLKTIENLRERWAKKAIDADMEYQRSGISRYRTTYEKYDKYCEILDLAKEQIEQTNRYLSKRMENINYFANSLNKETYTKKEVKDLLDETIFM